MRQSLSVNLPRKILTKVFSVGTALVLLLTGLGGGLPVVIAQTAYALSGASNVYMSPAGSGDCSQANPCSSFTDALNAVATNGTVHLAAGTYSAAVSITKSVRIIGAGEGATFIVAPASLPAEGSIIDISGPSVGATISRLTVEGAGPSTCGSIMSGIFVENSATANLHDLAVAHIRDNPLSGCQNGRAILVGWGHGNTIPNTTGHATISHVSISDYQKAGVEISGAGSSATVDSSTITGVGATPAIAANGIEITFGAVANVTHDTVTGNSYTGADFATGILLYNAADATKVSGDTVSGNQFGLWTNTPGSLTHLNISGITGNGRDAVADTTGWPTPPAATYADSALSGVINADGSTIVMTQGHAHVWEYDAFNMIQSAVNAVATGGHVYVANGTYHENLSIPKNGLHIYGQSRAGTIVNTDPDYGVTIDHQNNTRIDNMTFNTGGNTGYALHAYGANGLSLSHLTFNGPGKNTHVGGVDINSSPNVSLNDVISQGYGKNGFAITAKYVSTDDYSRGITFNGITATGNGWDGIAFYTTNSAGNVGHNITGVTFNGANTITNNGNGANPTQGGIFIEGDSDAAYFFCGLLGNPCPGTPHYTVTSPDGVLLLNNTSFSGNSNDIINFQTAGVGALGVQFNGLTGNQMTAVQHDAENALIFDHRDESVLGLVNYYTSTVALPAPTLLTPGPGAVVNGASVTNSWSAVPGAVAYEYESFNSNDPNSTPRFDADFATTSKTATNVADGTAFYWRVRAIDSEGNLGAWSNGGALWQVTIDNVAPVVHITAPTSNLVHGTVTIGGTVADANPDHYYLVVKDAQGNVVAGPGTVYAATVADYSWDTTKVSDGTYTIDLEARDKAGNKDSSSTATMQVVVDNTAPTGLANSWPQDGTYTTTNGLTHIDWTDAIDAHGPATYYYESSHSPATNADSSFVYPAYRSGALAVSQISTGGTPAGTYYWHVRAVDALGNSTLWTGAWKIVVDNTAPTVPTITAPTNGQYFNHTPITDSWTSSTDDLSGVDHYQIAYLYDDGHTFGGSTCPGVQIGGKSLSGCRDTTATSRDHVPGISEQGGVTIWVRAFDKSGNASAWSSPVHYYYDATAPVIDDTFTVNMLTGGKLTLNPTVTDSSPVTYQWVVSDNKLLNNPHDPLDGASLVIGPAAPANNYTVTLTVTDAAGNSTTKQYALTISTPAHNTPPVDHFSAPQTLGANTSGTNNDAANTDTPNTPPTNDNGHVKGDSITATASTTPQANLNSKNAAGFLGLGWWWLAPLAALFVLFLLVVFRRSGTDDKRS